MKYRLLYPDFKQKAVTFSFDDGTFYDVFLIELLNRYHMKGTFNINSGLFGENANLMFEKQIVFHNRLSKEQAGLLYRGHEIASHSVHHPLLTEQPIDFLNNEVVEDIKNLNQLSAEKVVGFAYPGGPHTDFTDAYLQDKVLYARLASSTYSFAIPQSFIPFDPTIFYLDKKFEKLSEEYIQNSFSELTWLYVWGHSYEFAIGKTYQIFKRVCKKLSKQNNIWFATNCEIIEYVQCARALKQVGSKLFNDGKLNVYLEFNGLTYIVSPNSFVQLKE